MWKRLPADRAGLILALALKCCTGLDWIAPSALAEAPPTPEAGQSASLAGSGCESTRPPSEVIKACTALLQTQPNNADLLAQRGNAYRQVGNTAAAFKDFNAAIALDPANLFALSRRVGLDIASGNEAATQADIDRILAVTAVAAKDFEARGVARALRRDHAGAITEYSAGLQLEPSNPLLLVNRAAAYMALRNVAAAMADYQRLVEAHPNYAFAHYVRGKALTAQKQFDAAIIALETAIRLDPDRPPYYVERGRAQLGKKRYDLALPDFDKAIEMNPALLDAHYNRALLHFERRDYDKTIVDLTAVIALNPRFAPAYTVRGQAYAQGGHHDRALADYAKALQLDPRPAEVWLRRSSSLLATGELDRAIADLDEAIKLAPGLANAYLARAHAKNRKHDAVGAVEDADKAIQLQPMLAPAYIARASAHTTLRQFDQALTDYNKVIELLPKSAEMYLRRAEVLEALGRTQSANADRARAASLSPQAPSSTASLPNALPNTGANAGANSALGSAAPGSSPPRPGSSLSPSNAALPRSPTSAQTAVMLRAAENQIGRGEYDLAISELDKVLVLEPGSWAAYALRGLAYGGKKQYSRALLDASRAIDVNGSAALGFTIRCSIQLQTKAYEKALADCNKSIEIGPANAASYALRGNAHLLLKSFDLAIADFDKAIAMGATHSQALFSRGLAYFYAKNFSKAAEDFRKVLETEPEHRGATLALRLLTQPSHNNAPMQINIVRNADPHCGNQCAEWIAAEGRIDAGTPARFRAVLKAIEPRRLPIFIDSMGGSLEASYAIGRMIRARNLDVYVTRTEPATCTLGGEACRKAEAAHIKFGFPRGKLASCASACTNILASGSVRSVGPTALVGIHQAAYYVRQKDVLRLAANRRIPEHVYVKMKDFLVEMGVDSNLMSRLLSTPHQDMYWLTHDDLKTSRLATQTKSGEELIVGSESDDWIVVSPKLANGIETVTARPPRKPR